MIRPTPWSRASWGIKMSESPFKLLDGTAPLVYWPYCHPEAPLRVTLLFSAVMVLNCSECNQEVGRFKAEEFVAGEWKCKAGHRASFPPVESHDPPLCTLCDQQMRGVYKMEPLTWRESALELSKIAESHMKRARQLEEFWPTDYAIPVEDE